MCYSFYSAQVTMWTFSILIQQLSLMFSICEKDSARNEDELKVKKKVEQEEREWIKLIK